MGRFPGTLIVIAVTLGGAAPLAFAQPASAEAETLFRQGREFLAAGKLEQACGAFESSQKLAPAPTTQLNLADCREKLGQLATAWGLFVEVQRGLRDATDKSGKNLAKVAGSHAQKLEPLLSKLTITVAQDHQLPGLEVHRGNDAVDAGAWNLSLPIDGGTYVISAHAPGHDDWSTTLTIKAQGDKSSVEVPVLPVSKVAATPVATKPTGATATGAASTGATGTTGDATPPPPPAQGSRTSAYLVGGAAIVLAGAAVGFDLWGNSTYNSSKTEPDPTKQTSEWHSANDKRYAADGLAVGAIAAAGVAVWLFVRSGGSSEATPASADDAARERGVHVVPMMSADGGGLALSGRY